MNYAHLLAAAQADPATADFHALRMAHAQSDAYAPYVQHADAVVQLRDALRGGDLGAAQAAVEALLAFYYLDVEAHMAADYVHTRREDHAAAAFHRAFARGLIDAILAAGTGRDFASAYILINPAELNVVLRVLGLIPGPSRTVQHADRVYELATAQRPDGASVEVYFDVDLPRQWLRRQPRGDHDHEHDQHDRADARTQEADE